MKSKLTVNRLAIGNLKARKKQYTVMIIGIILAMIFSSSIIFFMASANETHKAETLDRFGAQDMIISAKDFTRDDYEQMKKEKLITSYGLGRCIGFVYTDNLQHGSTVCIFDDDAKRLSHQTLIEGTYPSAKNEIAIEKRQLITLGYANADVGDIVKLKFKAQNGWGYLDETEKEYKIAGILSNKKNNIDMYFSEAYGSDNELNNITPAVFVSGDTEIEPGGRENLIAYASIDRNYLKKYAKQLHEQNPQNYYETNSIIPEYISNKCGEDYNVSWAYSIFGNDYLSFDSLIGGGSYYIIIVFVLVFASCVAIVNAFNSNLKERKKQIGFLRAVGTTKRQIVNIFGREALIISLITAPISTLISFGLVRLILSFMSESAVMSNSITALIVSMVINIAVVMLASLIPLLSAAKITPMQAIRNIDNSRILKNKKIKTVKQFGAAKLIAKRDLVFYKGSKIAVCIILVVSILFTCWAGTQISYQRQNLYTLPSDYMLTNDSYYVSMDNSYLFFNTADGKGFSQSQLNELAAKPYAGDVYGEKTLQTNMLVDEYSEYMYIFDAADYIYRYKYSGTEEKSGDVRELYDEVLQNKLFFDDEYERTKKYLNVDKELYTLEMYAYDDEKLLNANTYLVDGRIDIDKIASGEEIILVAPQEVELRASIKIDSNSFHTVYDDDCRTKDVGMKTIARAECPYKVGDEIDLVTAQANINYNEEDGSVSSVDNITQTERKVKVGAIVSTNEKSGLYIHDFAVLTSLDGLENFAKNVEYCRIELNSAYELDEVSDKEITDDLLQYVNEMFLSSNYDSVTLQKENTASMIIAVISIVIIAFAVCAGIINNSVTARIRESKRAIGTMRAVGAPAGELIKLYILQILSMLSTGTFIGYGIFIVGFLIVRWFDPEMAYDFNPWISLVMSCVLFAVCTVNIYIKVKKEMKNSIVDNIREL